MTTLNDKKASEAKLLLEQRGSMSPELASRRRERVTVGGGQGGRHSSATTSFFGYAKNIFLGDSQENSAIQDNLDAGHPEMARARSCDEHVDRIKRAGRSIQAFSPSREGRLMKPSEQPEPQLRTCSKPSGQRPARASPDRAASSVPSARHSTASTVAAVRRAWTTATSLSSAEQVLVMLALAPHLQSRLLRPVDRPTPARRRRPAGVRRGAGRAPPRRAADGRDRAVRPRRRRSGRAARGAAAAVQRPLVRADGTCCGSTRCGRANRR